MDKLVSIVLPTYNGSKFIRESIDSCLQQTYKNIELIIVNDCSTDQTEEIIQSYHDDRIIYVKNEQNQKLPRSLNVGFSKAKGEYLTWTSDDNYYSTDAVEKMVEHLEKQEADLVYAPYKTIDETGEITGSRTVGEVQQVLEDNIVKACFLYKKKVQDKLGGYGIDLFLVEDYDFWIRAVYHDFKLSPIPEELYYYRFHEGSLTESRRKQISAALYSLLVMHLTNFQNTGKTVFLNAEVYLKLANLAHANGEKYNSKKFLLKTIQRQPAKLFSKNFLKLAVKNLLT